MIELQAQHFMPPGQRTWFFSSVTPLAELYDYSRTADENLKQDKLTE